MQDWPWIIVAVIGGLAIIITLREQLLQIAVIIGALAAGLAFLYIVMVYAPAWFAFPILLIVVGLVGVLSKLP